ncbi:MAG: LysR substrate-binding domain-containing protein [Pigmentiphaga sp.]|nr:LysR substrate-binding domain-containing protein [Pigmentiphaga sp.]
MQLHQLRALVAVADAGSISAAARALHLSQPALTRSLKQLEIEVGASLLRRTRQGVTLTECGQALLLHARLIASEVDDARQHVSQLAGNRSGQLAVASSAVPFTLIVPQAVAIMRRRFPDVYLRLHEAVYPPVLELFRQQMLDFALGPLPQSGLGEEYRCDPLFELDLVVAARRDHPQAHANSLRQLADWQWIITGPLHGPGAVHETAFRQAGFRPPLCAMHCEATGCALQILEQSDLLSFVPRRLAEQERDAGRLAIIDIREDIPSLQIALFLPARKILSPAGQALYSAIHSVSRGLYRG